MLSKNVNSKKCAPKFILLNEKNPKDSDDFGHKKLTLKNQILAHFDTSPLHQFEKFKNLFWVC